MLENPLLIDAVNVFMCWPILDQKEFPLYSTIPSPQILSWTLIISKILINIGRGNGKCF